MNDNERNTELDLIDLGKVSEETQGANGPSREEEDLPRTIHDGIL